eukprot:scaffold92282_cov75-Phaeocystis_antarctica.AAC.4
MHMLRERQQHLSSESPSPRKEKCSSHFGWRVCRIVSLLKVYPPSSASSQKVSRSFLLWCSSQASRCSKRLPKGLWWSSFGDAGLSVISAAFRSLAPCRCTRTTPRPLSSHSSTLGDSSRDDCISAGGLAGGLRGGSAARCAAARCASAAASSCVLAPTRAASALASALPNFCEGRFPCAVIPECALSISRKLSSASSCSCEMDTELASAMTGGRPSSLALVERPSRLVQCTAWLHPIST